MNLMEHFKASLCQHLVRVSENMLTMDNMGTE
jgi:hypothetical protein